MCASGRPISRSMASGLRSAWASIGSRSSTPYRRVVSTPRARSARVMTSRMTGPRRLPTWTVPEGVLESLTTCGPSTLAASSSAQSTCCPSLRPRVGRWSSLALAVVGPEGPGWVLADLDDRVREVPGGDLHEHLLALLLAEQGAAHGRLVGDLARGRLGLRGAHDLERLGALVAVHLHGGADLDVVAGGVLVDQRRVLDHRLEGLDPALDERLLVLGVLVLGVLAQVAVLFRVMDPLGDLGAPDVQHLLELRAELLEAVLADVGRLAVHWRMGSPRCGTGATGPSPLGRCEQKDPGAPCAPPRTSDRAEWYPRPPETSKHPRYHSCSGTLLRPRSSSLPPVPARVEVRARN